MQSFDIPILVLIFNREEKTRKVLERLKEIRPKQLFVSADGPRKDKDGEDEKCRLTRAVFKEVDWDCEIHELFRDENLGCKKAVYGGITWFFEQVEKGIILEDDCVPDPSFFPFCDELLERYKDNHQITHITAHNPLGNMEMESSYFYSNQVLVWGWATWKRAWKTIDINMEQLPQILEGDGMKDYLSYIPAQKYIINKWQESQNGTLDSWAYPWAFSSFIQNGLAIIPKTNLIHNIGFDGEATNTNHHKPTLIESSLSFPLKHPERLKRDGKIDLNIFFHSQKGKTGLIIRDSILFRFYSWIFNAIRSK